MIKLLKKSWNVIKNLAIKTYQSVKRLGWFWGTLAVLISGAVFYSPSIVALVLYITTEKAAYLAFSIGYAAWWFSPAFSPAILTFMVILLFTVKVIDKLRGHKPFLNGGNYDT